MDIQQQPNKSSCCHPGGSGRVSVGLTIGIDQKVAVKWEYYSAEAARFSEHS
jgi:hypothetical protein